MVGWRNLKGNVMMIKVIYQLSYWIEFENGSEVIKVIGLFSSVEKAIKAAKELQESFEYSPSDICPQGLHIEKIFLDKTSWDCGFVTL